MATGTRNGLLWHLRRAALLRDGAGLADSELLECYIARRDEAALEALLRRHGPMVLGVCRRVLRNEADAEDAFQATFLVLVRKAATVRPRGQVSNWLYGVAYRTALKARAQALRRQAKEREAGTMARPEPPDEVWQRLQEVLDQELHTLPDRYRVPLVLCDLEGKTRKEAARQLGWPEGSVASRLARGRCLLARRLVRHGLPFSGGALAVLLAEKAATAALPLPLAGATLKAAAAFAAGQAAGAISAPVAALADGVLKALFLSKLKVVLGVVVFVALATATAGYVGRASAGGEGKADSGQAPSYLTGEMGTPRAGVMEPVAVCTVEWHGQWWPAFVRTARGGEYFIHYAGYDDTWDEWVTSDRIRLLRVSVESKGKWRPAALLQCRGEQICIRYTDPEETRTEWVPPERVRSEGCWVEWQGRWWRAEVLETKGGEYKIHYVGYDNSWDEWVGEGRIRLTALRWDDPAVRTDKELSWLWKAAKVPPNKR